MESDLSSGPDFLIRMPLAMGLSLADHLHMQLNPTYDAAIVGGGLAGLAAAIGLRKKGWSVVLFEKEKFPFHKVCGEYVSLESWNFLESIGLPLSKMNLPIIDHLLLTAPNGKSFNTTLPQGGFGISRYRLDSLLSGIAEDHGVHLAVQTKVEDIHHENKFVVHSVDIHGKKTVTSARVCCNAFGKRSNLDIKWKRDFLQQKDRRLENYVGIKYHVQTNWPQNLIGLHNFENGYCGISKVEDERFCLCYMTRAENLKKSGNDIRKMEEQVLYQNPHLKKIFISSDRCTDFPVTISQISFGKKTQIENHMLLLGDAAGMITPLCGNGMSIALHTAKLATELVDRYLSSEIDLGTLEASYSKQWKHHFAGRLQTGRILQRFFGSNSLSNFFVQSFRRFPFLASPLIRMTHGCPF
ncbi:MAG: NAD(P)/FAD-dependent oxidoreductase [Flavisolibacter sp.]